MNIPEEIVKAAAEGIAGVDCDEHAECFARAALEAAAPLIAAQVLRSAAEDTAGQCSHPDGQHPTGYCDFQHIAGRLRDRADRQVTHCSGCLAADKGADRLDYRHARGCPAYDAFYDATDEELSGIVARHLPPAGSP